MKKLAFALALILALSLVTTQVLAGPQAIGNPKKTPGTPPGLQKTPGPKHTPAAPLHGKRQNYRGTISAVGEGSLTLTLSDGSSITIAITAETRIRIPGVHQGGLAALQVGMKAVVQALKGENGNLVARGIAVIPGKPSRTHRVGWVTDYQPGISITIQARDGQLYTFQLTPQTRILPAERADQLATGRLVTIVAPRIPAQSGWIAVGIVVHPAAPGEGVQPPATPTPTP